MPVNFGRDKFGRDRLRQDDVDHLHAVKMAITAQKTLRAAIVLGRHIGKGQVFEVPAGEGSRGLSDVFLAVMAHPHGEKLHDLAGEILVRRALHVDPGIQKRQHGRVLRGADQQLAEVAGAL